METLIENSVNSGEDSRESILSQANTYSLQHNPRKEEQTASPDKYPQGWFKDKACKTCSGQFSPKAPSEHYCSDKCKDVGIQNAYLTRKYGISLSDYHSMLEEQNHRCKICGGEGFTMGKQHKMKLVVDHCHSTGAVRGLLCHNCNRALGLLGDDIPRILKCAEYLKVQRLS